MRRRPERPRAAVVLAATLLGAWTPAAAGVVPLDDPVEVTSVPSAVAREPIVAGGSTGEFVVAWTEDAGGGEHVLARRFDAAGQATGAAFQIEAAGPGAARRPSIAMTPDGGFVVAFERDGQDGSGTGVFARRFDAAGAPLGSEFQANTYATGAQWYPSIAADGAGNFVVVWQSDEQEGPSNDAGIFAQRFDASGNAQGPELHVNQFTLLREQTPTVAADGAGNFIVAWVSVGHGLVVRSFDEGGVPLSGDVVVDSPAFEPVRPALAANPSGTFVIAWRQLSDGTNPLDVLLARTVDLAGTLGAGGVMKAILPLQHARRAVAVDDGGRVLLAWDAAGQDGDGRGAFARHLVGPLEARDPEFIVPATTAGDQRLPAVAALGSGRFVVTWDEDAGVFHRRYTDAVPPPTDRPISGLKLVLGRRDDGRDKLVFVSKDGAFGFPAIGGPDDPFRRGATLTVSSENEGWFAYFAPPGVELGWRSKTGAPNLYRFANRTLVDPPTLVRTLVLKEGTLLKMAGKYVFLPLQGPQGAVSVRLTTGSLRSCARFDPDTVKVDRPGRYVAKRAPADALADCSDASLGIGSPSGAFVN